jgi:hypothetical protein
MAIFTFLDQLREELRREAPGVWEQWWPAEAAVTR